ncbi:hypothetical protein FRZ67_16180 [Panacibacter ginsenosidivorans]|uniref:Uncharacterized protein n=1 Tax=Panacibacter ginsenosidivorans TaxID=1813871 RepID=A0A5B8VB86_9BACT|nr:hypothetical protein [Panacibacter ginsenosidivorans]QEC68767.1 hypothetical protein FRZ67_16180 [Panacibacter ginsenosidivorans]
MMIQKTIEKQRKKDLSHIDNLADLHREIRLVKARIKNHEQLLAEHWKKLPAETFKLVVRRVVPFYLNNKVLDKSWGVLSSAFSILSGDKSNTAKSVMGAAKKLGLFTAIRAGYNLFRKKK